MDSRIKSTLLAIALFTLTGLPAAARNQPHNIIIFVADGLRYGSVLPDNMPNMARLKAAGVDFINSHSLFPTVTTVNASAIATGHYIGDTGDFGNTIYVGQTMDSLGGSTMGFLESDKVLEEMNRKFAGNYLGETSLIAAARAKGWQTAIIGKEGPALIQDVTTAKDGSQTLVLDDSTGKQTGIGLPDWFAAGMTGQNLAPALPAIAIPNVEQEAWMAKAATQIVLPHFAQSGKPFVMLFWSRDPDTSQHDATDSVGKTDPGINNPSARAGARNADTVLGQLLDSLKALGLDKTTDVFVTADHGFVTVSKDDNGRDLPQNFLSADLAKALDLPMAKTGYLGADAADPELVVGVNSGADLIYLPGADAKALAGRVVNFLAAQDYVSGIFVNDGLGKFPGALPMSAVNLIGAARTPAPAIYVSFRTFAGTCPDRLQCAIGVYDSPRPTGEGEHGGLSRAETRNFMAVIGPDFKKGFADPAPISNADIAPTLARVMGVPLPARGKLTGRVISEGLAGGKPVKVTRRTVTSDPGPGGVSTILDEQSVGQTRYFDAAGFEGRTVGLLGH